ncbi:MAG: hypothetical protein RL701_2819 [Pseudomonadota bacterium]
MLQRYCRGRRSHHRHATAVCVLLTAAVMYEASCRDLRLQSVASSAGLASPSFLRMIRCFHCGVRLRALRPHCPVHGPDAVSAAHPSVAPARDAWDSDSAELVSAWTELGYRVDGIIGRGGFSVVYSATRIGDAGRDRVWALKLATPQQHVASAPLLLHECGALVDIGPPHVPEVYELGNVLARPYIALEYLGAHSLAERLEAYSGPMPLEAAAKSALRILDALAAIHTRGYVHRDLKPENIFISLDETVATFIDFGLARRVGQRPSKLELMASTLELGTSDYMAPEQCDGLPDADVRSDIYSFGVLLYELLTGAPPFYGNTTDVREAHRSRRPAPLQRHIRCSAALDAVVRRCLAKDRDQRFENVARLRSALEAALAAKPSLPPLLVSRAPVRNEPATSSAPRERRKMGVVFFESTAAMDAVRSSVALVGGQLVHAAAPLYVAAFGHELGDNPGRIALWAGQKLLDSQLAVSVCVDVVAVSVQLRADGTRRILSPVFAQKERFPDRAGLQLTAAAAELVAELALKPLTYRPDRFSLERSGELSALGLTTQAPVFVGRTELLRALHTTLAPALQHAEPTLITIIGDAGCGRTQLARTLSQELERSGDAYVLQWTAQERIIGMDSPVLPDMLRRLLDLPDDRPDDGGRALFVSKLGESVGEQVWVAAALVLGWLDQGHPEARRLEAAPGALRLAAARAAGQALRYKARMAPVVVVLDDAHLADGATLDALEYATLREGAARLWVCMLSRPGFSQMRPGLGTRAAHRREVALGPLAPEDAAELARQLLFPVEHIPEQALTRLVERTRGMPRSLVELISGLKRDGIVRKSERGTGYYLATEALETLPELPIAEWNAKREIETLPSQLAGLVKLVSIFGTAFTLVELEALLAVLERAGLPEELQLDAGVGLKRLVSHGLLVRSIGETHNFRHSLFGQAVYALLSEDERRQYHSAAYQTFQNLPMSYEYCLPRLALHAARSGNQAVAASAYIKLAERARATHAYLQAELAFGSALDNMSAPDIRVSHALRGRGLMRFRTGRHEDALKDLRLARERAHESADRDLEVELMLDESTVFDWTREYPQSAELVRAASVVQIQGSPLIRARLALGHARTLARSGDPERAVPVGVEAAALAQPLGDVGYESYVIALNLVGFECANLGRLEESERYLDASLRAAESRGDLLHMAGCCINRAALWFAHRDANKAFDELERALNLAREIGSSLIENYALLNLGEVAYAADQLEQAQQYTLRAVEVGRALHGEVSREVSGSELMLARIAAYQGELAAARELVSRIRTRVARADEEGISDVALFASDELILTAVALAANDTATASLADAWEELHQRMQTIYLQPGEEVEVFELHALAAFRAGRHDESRAYFLKALGTSELKPNLLAKRVLRNYTRLFAQLAQ